jgi:hypothetical protein
MMKRFLILALIVMACSPMRKEKTYPLEWVTLKVSHRMYPNFKETHKVKPFEFFDIGDTDYRAKVVRFLPDFAIDDSGRIFSKSEKPENPAVLVEVWLKNKRVDKVWAFQEGLIPHFKASSMLRFEIVDFKVPEEGGDSL